MEKSYRTIVDRISKLYDKYQDKARKQAAEKKVSAGQGPDKNETLFIEMCGPLIQQLRELSQRMANSRALSEHGEMRQNSQLVASTAKDIELLRKNRILNFKANEGIMNLANSTKDIIPKLSTGVNSVESMGFCCTGDTKKMFRNTMYAFKEYAACWRLLAKIECKSGTETFVAQPFVQSEFTFIRDVLNENWPQNMKPIKEYVQVVKNVEVVKVVESGKPNKIATANEWLFGMNREFNPTIGLEIYHEEADRNDNASACTGLGSIYEAGHFIPKDDYKALSYYKKAMDLKDSQGMYLYAKGLEKGLTKEGTPTKQDLAQAFKLLTQAADSGNLEAVVDLGYVYENGHFDSPNDQLFTVTRDLKKAITLYNKARSERSPKASNNLGVLYCTNRYLDESNPNAVINTDANAEKNLKIAIRYLEQATHRGFPTAYYNLGSMHERGEGVQQSSEKARDLFHEGATKGDIKCKIMYGFHLIDQTSIFRESFDEEYRLAVRWLEDAIIASSREDELAKAHYYLGLYYEYGFGVDQKPKKAVDLFERAAVLVYPPAINKLGHCYYSGFGVKMDKMIAIGYYKQAAEEGNDEALVNLGTAYMNGIDRILEKNVTIAYEYFQAAMKAGNSDAYVHLSQMYQKGIYVKRDQKLARELLVMAALKKNQTAIYMLGERGQPIDTNIIDQIQQEMFIEPKAIDPNEIIPYIKDYAKARK